MNSNKTPQKILRHLKMNGPTTASVLANVFEMTSEGMRLHLLKLEERGLVQSERMNKGVGRPTIVYRLTSNSGIQFPDNHANLTVQILESVQRILGAEALQLLVEDKKSKDFQRYEKALENAETVEEKLERLTDIRNKEGYMAEWSKVENEWVFVENNCPICKAAVQCDGFCRAEIENIQKLLGEKLKIERNDHTVEGSRRCSYVIR
ncbi:MAG TPA: metalloregulator ArsR/SmtB family transcription factor [Bacteroidales bacterium]|nr:metalloregulator ArsR/SmtB family transcription factor [Bacteroidales bacterium]